MDYHGDLDLAYAIDDAGNYCKELKYDPSVLYKDGDDFIGLQRISEKYQNLHGDDINDLDEWVESLEKVVCIN